MYNKLLPLFIIFFSYDACSNTEVNNIGKITAVPMDNNNYAAGFYASKNTFGMRANAVVAAFKANSPTPFDYPIVGFKFLKAMGTYFDRDSVSLYADNSSPEPEPWEHISHVEYTPTSFLSKDIDVKKIKPGMLVDTDHDKKWSSYILSVSEGKVVTAGWVNTSTHKLGTPPNGKGLSINPVTKIWATNFNVYLTEKGQAQKGVIQENGMVNNKIEKPEYVNGLDTVIMPYSKFGGSSAYLARSGATGENQQWDIGFIAKGAKNSFVSADSDMAKISPRVSFLDKSHAVNGMIFSGNNQDSSILWSNGETIYAKIDPKGLISKIGYLTKKIKDSCDLSENIGRYIVLPNRDITLVLPSKEKIFSGYSMKIMRLDTGEYNVTFKSPDGALVNGSKEFKDSRKAWNGEAVFEDGEWFIE